MVTKYQDGSQLISVYEIIVTLKLDSIVLAILRNNLFVYVDTKFYDLLVLSLSHAATDILFNMRYLNVYFIHSFHVWYMGIY